jgi:hypothetical protein
MFKLFPEFCVALFVWQIVAELRFEILRRRVNRMAESVKVHGVRLDAHLDSIGFVLEHAERKPTAPSFESRDPFSREAIEESRRG